MIETWLDAVLGPGWRAAVGFYQEHAIWFAVPILAWMAIVMRSRRSVREVENEVRRGVRDVGRRALEMPPSTLMKTLRPQVTAVAARHTVMPTSHGWWITRAQPDRLLAQAGFTAAGIAKVCNELKEREFRA